LKSTGLLIVYLLKPIKLPKNTNGTETPNHKAINATNTGNLTYLKINNSNFDLNSYCI